MPTRTKLLSGAVIGAIGLLMAAVPAFDMWEDVVVEGKTPLTTFIENMPLLVLCGLIVVGGVWLARSDWEDKYARTVTKLTVGNVAGVALLIVLIVYVQFRLQGELKPFIIAADAVIIGALGGIVIGVRTAQHQQATDTAEIQRERAQALFTNHTDAVASIRLGNDALLVEEVNDEFTDTFGYRADGISDLLGTIIPADKQGENEATAVIKETSRGNQIRREMTLDTNRGDRQFLVHSVPIRVTSGTISEAYFVFTDITEQKKREQQLEFLNSLLRHDIQNAMTVIRARAEQLAETLDGRNGRFATTIVERSDEVVELTDQFRRMLDALTGDQSEELDRVSLATIIDDEVERLDESYPDVRVEQDIPDGIEVVVDDLFENVIWNLLDNAVEHNDTDEPEITVTANERDGSVRVEIADNGPGVPDDLKESIFRRNASAVDNAVGSGFGLFFVDQMVDRYGGDIWVEDNDPRGAVFVLSLPTP